MGAFMNLGVSPTARHASSSGLGTDEEASPVSALRDGLVGIAGDRCAQVPFGHAEHGAVEKGVEDAADDGAPTRTAAGRR